ncbi:DUF2933 domain-containing protein [Halobacillus shinanisalinarum]|uniref:DUF2933 domain-containing protein n=1 Tax=Halobacillus shinanisalinarum TaxID=2932258 RepID=A0ABY4H308_9BACI|nr:DUF2933 domain-containing protein [Halobacillus shinanisalinarum]UOQ94007.1 DUF2933 domain-containing protein [Halobacillus shinanisalinarum]
MSWELLILLACPLMMMFCMKGMFSGNKDRGEKGKETKSAEIQPKTSPQDVQSLQIKMAELMEENQKLMKEIKDMKETQSSKESPTKNVVGIKEGQEKKTNTEVS